MTRVLKDDGFAVVRVPDLACIADKIKDGLLTHKMYDSNAGDITVLDMIYGHRRLIQEWGDGMGHKTGFTEDSMRRILSSLGINAMIKTSEFHEVIALIYKDKVPQEYMDFGRF
jgi:hypothetical protein